MMLSTHKSGSRDPSVDQLQKCLRGYYFSSGLAAFCYFLSSMALYLILELAATLSAFFLLLGIAFFVAAYRYYDELKKLTENLQTEKAPTDLVRRRLCCVMLTILGVLLFIHPLISLTWHSLFLGASAYLAAACFLWYSKTYVKTYIFLKDKEE
jgi:Na+/H+ antiporter NhaD/arsenite permease-like protein